MFTSNQVVEFKSTVEQFTNACYENYHGYAHGAGFLEWMLVEMYSQLPKKQQKEWTQKICSYLEKEKRNGAAELKGDKES